MQKIYRTRWCEALHVKVLRDKLVGFIHPTSHNVENYNLERASFAYFIPNS